MEIKDGRKRLLWNGTNERLYSNNNSKRFQGNLKVLGILLIKYCYQHWFYSFLSTTTTTTQAQRKQLESGAAKTEQILKTPLQKGFYFFISKNLILTGKSTAMLPPVLQQQQQQ